MSKLSLVSDPGLGNHTSSRDNPAHRSKGASVDQDQFPLSDSELEVSSQKSKARLGTQPKSDSEADSLVNRETNTSPLSNDSSVHGSNNSRWSWGWGRLPVKASVVKDPAPKPAPVGNVC